MRAKFGVLQQTHGIRLLAKFRLDRFILSNSVGENPIVCGFWTSAFRGVVSWQQSEKLDTVRNYKPSPTNGVNVTNRVVVIILLRGADGSSWGANIWPTTYSNEKLCTSFQQLLRHIFIFILKVLNSTYTVDKNY